MLLFIIAFAFVAASGTLATEYAVKGANSDALLIVRAVRNHLLRLAGWALVALAALWAVLQVLGWLIDRLL